MNRISDLFSIFLTLTHTTFSDGRPYVWTLNEKRKVNADILETFEAAVAAQVAKRAEAAEKQVCFTEREREKERG